MRRFARILALALSAGLLAVPTARAAKAKSAKTASATRASAATVSAASRFRRSPYVGALSADAATGRILFEDRADETAYIASVTKLMTALLVLEDVCAGRYALADRVTATPEVYRCEPSAVGIRAGQSMTVHDLLLALMVKSANDAAIALAVNASGSTEKFVARMNARAAALGMKATKYHNPNGLQAPKWAPSNNVSTCRDLLKLARELLNRHPEILKFSSVKVGEVTDGAGRRLRMVNHNNVMVKDKRKVFNPDGSEAVDGLKTGYIDAGGSSVVLTGRRGKSRAIVIVLGSSSAAERDENGARLMADALGSLAW